MKYYVTGTLEEKVQEVLEGGGAKKTAYLSGINTHCIVGTDPDYNEVSEAVDMLDVPSVEQEWVIASTHCRKLLPLKVTLTLNITFRTVLAICPRIETN